MCEFLWVEKWLYICSVFDRKATVPTRIRNREVKKEIDNGTISRSLTSVKQKATTQIKKY